MMQGEGKPEGRLCVYLLECCRGKSLGELCVHMCKVSAWIKGAMRHNNISIM